MSAVRILPFLAFIVCFPAGISSSQTSDCSYLSLLKYLNLTTTNEVLSVMRPVKKWTTPTVVQIDMVLFGILQVDEKSQTVTSHIWTQLIWTNEFLTWNSSDFCGIKLLTVPISKLWIPDISIQEDASDTGTVQRSPLASVFSEGYALTSARQRLTSTCKLKLWLFPFDVQNCNITFGSLLTDGENHIELKTFNTDTTLTKISEQIMVTKGEWELEKMEVFYNSGTNKSGNNVLTYMVTITRKPMLYVINLIVPLFYFLVLDLASFFISEARGEKLSFKITILLSISVLLLILQDMLPSTEDKLPMIASYCVAIFALVGISVLEAMLVSFLTDLDGYCGKKAQSSTNTEVEIQQEVDCHKEPVEDKEVGQAKQEISFFPLNGRSGCDLLKLILEEVKAARQEAAGQENAKRTSGHYGRVAKIIDSVFFVLYFLTVVVFLTYMYVVWIKQHE